ncbi:albumin [Suncus etruscus]|uniref:albumin n=1 Tax=Suncus etruscus TaxID=109475 RepID=UPI00210F58FE|nr:albumin [Suncus etruscus]
MKWVTFISLLFLFNTAYSRGVFRRDAHKSEIAHRFKDLGEENFKGLVLITFSQYLQKCPFEEHVKLVKEINEFAKTCVADEAAPNCDKSLQTLFGDKLCTIASLRERYGELADCCEKPDHEKGDCFAQHKDDNPDLPPMVRPSADALCASFQANEQEFAGHYLHEIARRHPYFYAPELLYYAHKYKEVLKECCSADDKAACLIPKMDVLKETVMNSATGQRFKCASIEKFGDRAFKAWALARLSQKFPNADFTEISKIVSDLTKINKECCHGDLLECADDRMELGKYMCDNKDSISSKLSQCCDKPLLEKSHCIAELEKDDMPADLTPIAADYVEDKDVCKNYKEAKDVFLGTFLYEFARRNPDHSIAMLLRAAKFYEVTLEKCCATDDPSACIAKVLEEIKNQEEEPKNLVKHNCDFYNNAGEREFQLKLLHRYTQRAPQVSTSTLVEIGHGLAKVASKCCTIPEEKRMSCAEDLMTVGLNRLCVLHEKNPVSERVTKCCTESLVNRRPCFSALAADETYVPKDFKAETFTFHADICTLPENEKQFKKHATFVELIKHKPKATDEQLKAVIAEFEKFMEKCCAADDKEACFAAEVLELSSF